MVVEQMCVLCMIQYGNSSLLQAQAAMEEMRMRIPSVNMAYYINIRTIEAIYRALDMPLPKTITSRAMNGYSGEEEDGEIVEEEVVDQINYGDDV